MHGSGLENVDLRQRRRGAPKRRRSAATPAASTCTSSHRCRRIIRIYTLLGSKEAKNIEDLARQGYRRVTGVGSVSPTSRFRIYSKRNNLGPDKRRFALRAIGPTALRAILPLEIGLISAAPFSAEEHDQIARQRFSVMIVVRDEAAAHPAKRRYVTHAAKCCKNILRRQKRFLKAVIPGMHVLRSSNKQEAIKTGYASGLCGRSRTVISALTISPSIVTASSANRTCLSLGMASGDHARPKAIRAGVEINQKLYAGSGDQR